MTKESKTTIYQLEKNLIDDLNENKKEIINSVYPEDLISEYVDNWIPIYNSDLIEVLSSDHNLAYVNDVGLLPENPNVHDIIKSSIYEKLNRVGFDWFIQNRKAA